MEGEQKVKRESIETGNGTGSVGESFQSGGFINTHKLDQHIHTLHTHMYVIRERYCEREPRVARRRKNSGVACVLLSHIFNTLNIHTCISVSLSEKEEIYMKKR